MYTREQLVGMSNEQLVEIVLQMQEVAERGKNITAYYNRKESNSKFSSITPERVAQMHLDGYSITEIKHKLDKELMASSGGPLNISIQTIMYKIRKYEKEHNVKIYKPGIKGRKKSNPTLFD